MVDSGAFLPSGDAGRCPQLEDKRTLRTHREIDANDPLLPSGPPIIGTAQTPSEPLSASLPLAMIQRAVPC
jgi:hypothetical protein